MTPAGKALIGENWFMDDWFTGIRDACPFDVCEPIILSTHLSFTISFLSFTQVIPAERNKKDKATSGITWHSPLLPFLLLPPIAIPIGGTEKRNEERRGTLVP